MPGSIGLVVSVSGKFKSCAIKVLSMRRSSLLKVVQLRLAALLVLPLFRMSFLHIPRAWGLPPLRPGPARGFRSCLLWEAAPLELRVVVQT